MSTNPFIFPAQVTQMNFLTNTEAILKIQRAPHLNFFTQGVPIPGVSGPPITIPTPHANIMIEGNRPLPDPLNITFKVDQDLNNYLEVLGWIYGLTKPRGFEDAQVFSTSGVDLNKLPKYSDGSVFILSNSKKPQYEVRYSKMLPVAISTVSFDTTQPNNTYAQATASFVYDYLEVYRVSDGRRLA